MCRDVDFGNMDSQRSFFVESGRYATRYIRVVRIGFVKPFDGRDVVVERPLEVNYVTFEPLMLSSGGIFGIPLFETMAQTMKRAIDWLQMVDPGLYVFCCLSRHPPRAGSGVERIDPLRFLVGCRKRQLNQALSILSLLA